MMADEVYAVVRTATVTDWIKRPEKIIADGSNDTHHYVIIGDSENGVYRKEDYPK